MPQADPPTVREISTSNLLLEIHFCGLKSLTVFVHCLYSPRRAADRLWGTPLNPLTPWFASSLALLLRDKLSRAPLSVWPHSQGTLHQFQLSRGTWTRFGLNSLNFGLCPSPSSTFPSTPSLFHKCAAMCCQHKAWS